MRVEDPSAAHVRYVADRMRDKDVEEFLPLSFATNRAELADLMVEKYGASVYAYCFSDGDEPVAVGAMVEARPNVITLMFFATDAFPKLALQIARFARQRLFPNYRAAGVHRIECVSIDGYEAAHRWIEILGLKREGGPMRGFGKGGETFHQFAWVKEEN